MFLVTRMRSVLWKQDAISSRYHRKPQPVTHKTTFDLLSKLFESLHWTSVLKKKQCVSIWSLLTWSNGGRSHIVSWQKYFRARRNKNKENYSITEMTFNFNLITISSALEKKNVSQIDQISQASYKGLRHKDVCTTQFKVWKIPDQREQAAC